MPQNFEQTLNPNPKSPNAVETQINSTETSLSSVPNQQNLSQSKRNKYKKTEREREKKQSKQVADQGPQHVDALLIGTVKRQRDRITTGGDKDNDGSVNV